MRKRHKVKITDSAQNDFAQIWDYISVDSPKNALEFLEQLEQRAYSLEFLPERHQVIAEDAFLRGNFRQLVYKDYRIIYRIQEDTVYIMRIIHSSKILD